MNTTNDYCLIGSITDIGCVRKVNEDSKDWFDSPNGRVVVVCDGMGGHVGGQIASQTAIKAIREYLMNDTFSNIKDAISNAIILANRAILNLANTRPELKGMGSTCVLLLVNEGKVYYAHVGDSRIYFVANHRIFQKTKDQSFVQMLVDAGNITKEQAEHHPRKNEITNALGFEDMTPPIICDTPIMPEAGNCFVLCSDGLSGMVSENKIEHVVSKHNVPIQQRADELVGLAKEAGGHDNITVQLVEFTVNTEDIGGTNSDKVINKKNVIIVSAIALILIIVGIGLPVFHKALEPKTPTPIVVNPVKPIVVTKILGKTYSNITLQSIRYISNNTLMIKIPQIKDDLNNYKCIIETPSDNTVSATIYKEQKDVIILTLNNFSANTKKISIRLVADNKGYIITIPIINNVNNDKIKQEKVNIDSPEMFLQKAKVSINKIYNEALKCNKKIQKNTHSDANDQVKQAEIAFNNISTERKKINDISKKFNSKLNNTELDNHKKEINDLLKEANINLLKIKEVYNLYNK